MKTQAFCTLLGSCLTFCLLFSSPSFLYAAPAAPAKKATPKKAAPQKTPKRATPKKLKKPRHELVNKKFLSQYNDALQKFRTAQIDTAIGVAQNILRTWPRSPRTLALLGWCYKSKQKYNVAINYFQRAANFFNARTEFYEKSQVLYNVAFCYELLKNHQSALAAWRTYLAFAGNYPQDSRHVTFARKRIEALTKVKVKK